VYERSGAGSSICQCLVGGDAGDMQCLQRGMTEISRYLKTENIQKLDGFLGRTVKGTVA
jgi:hypothetical protein